MVSPNDQPERRNSGTQSAAQNPVPPAGRLSESEAAAARSAASAQATAELPSAGAGDGPRSGDGARSGTSASDAEKRRRRRRRKHNRPVDVVVVNKPKKRHLFRKILIGLGIAILVLIIAVQIVLSSSLPKTIILGAIEKSLGLKAEAAGVKTGWWGHTSVTDVKLTIPLEDGPFLETKEIRVSHSALLMMLITGLEIQDMQVDQPIVHLRQSSSGHWNFSDIMGGMAKSGGAGGGGGDGGGGKAERTKLPAIDIRGATLQVTDRTGKSSQVGPLDFLGVPDQSSPDLVWQYTFNLPNQIRIDGRAVTGGDWRNEAKIQIEDLNPLVGPFVGSPLPAVKVAARWQGRAASGVEGTISIDHASAAGVALRGGLGVANGANGVTLTPQNLQIFSANAAPNAKPMLALTGGSVQYEDAAIRLNKLTASAGGGVAQIDGNFSPGSKVGDLSATWFNLGLPDGIKHDGTLKVKLGQSLTGDMEVSANLETSGRIGGGDRGWAGRIVVDGRGQPDDMNVHVTFPHFTLSSNRQSVPLDGLALQLAYSDKLGERPGGAEQRLNPGAGLSLVSTRLGDSQRLDATGFFLPNSKDELWGFHMRGSRWPLPLVDAEGLGLTIEMTGDKRIVHIDSIRIAGVETVVTLRGSYEYSAPQPLDVIAVLEHKTPDSMHLAEWVGAKSPPKKVVWGGLAGQGAIKGTLTPINLRMEGQLQGLALKVFDHDLGNISVKVRGEANDEFASVYRDPAAPLVELLGGRWDMKAIYAINDLPQMKAGASQLNITLQDLPLQRVVEMAGQEDMDIAGTASGWWQFHLPSASDVAHQLDLNGELLVKNIKSGPIEIESAKAGMQIDNGLLRVPLEVRHLNGSFTGAAAISVDNPKELELTNLLVKDWPVLAPPSTYLTIEASAPRVVVLLPDEKSSDPAARKIHFQSGPIAISTPVKVGDIDAGKANLNANLTGRVIHIPLIDAPLFGSQISAQATIDLDKPNAMTALMHVRDVDPHQLAKMIPALRSLSGKMNIDFSVGPTNDPLATEPLAAEVWFTPRDMIYRQGVAPPIDDVDSPLEVPPGGATRPTSTAPSAGEVPSVAPNLSHAATQHSTTVPATIANAADGDGPGIQVGLGRFRILLGFDEKFQLDRMVLADQNGVTPPRDPNAPPPKIENAGQLPVNTLQMGGGALTFWGRMTRNENEYGVKGYTTVSSQFRLAFADLDLNQIMQAFKPDGKPTAGRISGEIVANGATGLDIKERSRVRRRAATTQPDENEFLTRLIGSMQGEGRVTLRNSDLANIKMIAGLYNLLRTDIRTPTGNGTLNFHIEKSNAYITAFRYFNRGVEVRAVGEIHGLERLRDARVRATAYGSIRTLKEAKLPIIRSVIPDLDQVLSAIQQNGVSVSVTGTVYKPVVKPVLFSDLGQQMRELLVGDYKRANSAPAQK